jgi:hypothetical protein
VLILSHVHLSFSSRNKMICIQSIKKYNITFLQKNMIFVFCCFCRIVVSWTIFPQGSKIVHGCYFDRTRTLLSFKLLDRKRSIISVASIIYISPILQCLNGALITFLQKNMIFVFCCFCRIVVSWTIFPRLSIFH